MHYVSRIARSLAIAVIMLLSARALGFTPAQASLAALIPFLLGTIDVMAGTAFSMSGAVFIAAVLAHVFPTEFVEIKGFASQILNEAGSTLVVSGTNSSPAIAVPATPANPPPVVSATNSPASTPVVIPAATASPNSSPNQKK